MTDKVNEQIFSADRPITTRDEDLLGRRGFAESIAKAIAGWSGDESLVVGIYGPWGSGKSSVKNMVLEALRAPRFVETQAPIVVEYNPWQFAGQGQLTEGFFGELAAVLGRQDKEKQLRRLASRFREYGRLFAVVTHGLTGLRSGLKFAAAALVVLSATGAVLSWAWVQWFILPLALGLGVLTWSSDLFERVSGWLDARAEREERSLSEVKGELAEALSGAGVGRSILVVLDDVDRLTRDEIRLLFQLIKANLDLPRMVYLVLFQQDVVERSLEEPGGISGKDFLSKIVQVGIDLPVVERPKLERILNRSIEELLGEHKLLERFDRARWYDIYRPGLSHYFRNLREVYRYVSALKFHMGILRVGGTLEADPVDLIGLEVLRVFEPDVYHRLPSGERVLTRQQEGLVLDGIRKEAAEAYVKALVEAAPEGRREWVRAILRQLFPPAQWVLGGFGGFDSGFVEQWVRELRVCVPMFFGRYFHLAVPEGDVSQAEIERILSLTGDRAKLAAELQSLNERGLLGPTLSRLEPYKQQIDLSHAVSVLTALFDIGDDLPEEEPGRVAIGPDVDAFRIAYWLLKKEEDKARRGEILRAAIQETRGVYLPAKLVSAECRTRDRGEEPSTRLLGDVDLDRLRVLCLRRIETAAQNSSLLGQRQLLSLLFDWQRFSSREAPAAWVQQIVRSDGGLLGFLRSVLQRGTSTAIGTYHMTVRRYIPLSNVDAFIDPGIIEKRVGELPAEKLNREERTLIAEFRKAVLRRREGRGDHDWQEDGNNDGAGPALDSKS